MSDQPSSPERPTSVRRQPRRLKLVQAVLAGTLLLPTATACGSSNHYDQYANCIDASGLVVSDNYCDDPAYYNHGGYWLYMAGSHYGTGSRISGYNSGNRISPNDTTARGNAGLPRSGKVTGVVVKSGGIGSGSSHSGSHTNSHSSSGS